MRILILGAGKMGSFFTDLLSFNHDVAVLEKDPRRMRFIYNAQRFTSPEEIADFRPELLINCVTLNATLQAFEEVFPYLPKECIISDIASVKTGLQEFYEKSGFRYVSTHPMFGPRSPTWATCKPKTPSSSRSRTTWAKSSSRTSTVR